MLTTKNYFCRLIGLALTVLIISILLVSPTRAQAETRLRISPQASGVAMGNAITIAVEVSGGNDLNAYDLTIVYDEEVLTLESWSHGGYLSNLAVVKKVENPGSFRLVATQLATAGVSGDGTLINLVFRGLNPGVSEVSLQEVKFSNSSSESVIPSVSGGVVTVNAVPEPTWTATNTLVPTATSTLSRAPTSTKPPAPAVTHTRTPTPLPPLAPTFTMDERSTQTDAAPSVPGITAGSTTPAISEGQSTEAAPVEPGGSPETDQVPTLSPRDQNGENHSRLNTLLWTGAGLLVAILAGMIVFYFKRKQKDQVNGF